MNFNGPFGPNFMAGFSAGMNNMTPPGVMPPLFGAVPNNRTGPSNTMHGGQNSTNFPINGMNLIYDFEVNSGAIHVDGQNHRIHIGVNTGILAIRGMNHYVVVDRNEGMVSAQGMNHRIEVRAETQTSRVHSHGMNINIQQSGGNLHQRPQGFPNSQAQSAHVQGLQNPPISGASQNQGDWHSNGRQNPSARSQHASHQDQHSNRNQQHPRVRMQIESTDGMLQNLFSGIFGPAGPFGMMSMRGHRMPPNRHHHHHQHHHERPERPPGEVHADRIVSGSGKVIPIELIQGPTESSAFNCPICCEDADKTDDDICVVECLHWYHFSCLSEWLKKSADCPTCRLEVAVVLKVAPRQNQGPARSTQNHTGSNPKLTSA
jgi:Ring finger domain